VNSEAKITNLHRDRRSNSSLDPGQGLSASSAVLVAQDQQCPCRAAEIGPSGRQESTGRDLERRKQTAGNKSREGVRGRLGAKWPKAAAKITDDLDVLLAFYDFPAGHWVHLRTTNPVESTFTTVRLRHRVTKGPGSRAAGVAMAFKLIESAQRR